MAGIARRGKGQRRREKNYQAAHGGDMGLPPPPNLKELEAIHSKLRKIMELRNNNNNSSSAKVLSAGPTRKEDGGEKGIVNSAVAKKKRTSLGAAMGGKGQRRREKNYRAAHDGDTGLPPPPNLKELEAIPSKLRKIMELRNNNNNSSSAKVLGAGPTRKDDGGEKGIVNSAIAKKKRVNTKDEPSPDFSSVTRDGIQGKKDKNEDSITIPSLNNEGKSKRKRKAVKDLRFQDLDHAAGVSRKKKRREYLEAKKKKNKKSKTDAVPGFPGREEIKFGEIVEAPPKLSVLKKSTKTPLDAFHERIRLQTIEAYRNRKGWTSRPGVQIPMPENPS